MIAFFFFFFENSFSTQLRAAMEKKGFVPETLASRADVSDATVRRWLRGIYEPRHINLKNVACALDIYVASRISP